MSISTVWNRLQIISSRKRQPPRTAFAAHMEKWILEAQPRSTRAVLCNAVGTTNRLCFSCTIPEAGHHRRPMYVPLPRVLCNPRYKQRQPSMPESSHYRNADRYSFADFSDHYIFERASIRRGTSLVCCCTGTMPSHIVIAFAALQEAAIELPARHMSSFQDPMCIVQCERKIVPQDILG